MKMTIQLSIMGDENMKYQLTGEVEIRDDFTSLKRIDHTETVEASSEEEAIELSLNGFSEEEEPVWVEGPTVTAIA